MNNRMRKSGPKRRATPTLNSLARELGVSTCTVSNVLNNSPDSTYSIRTIERVKNLAKLRGFVPNIHGRNLRKGKSMTIGVVLPAGMPIVTGALVELFELELSKHGYDTVVIHTTPESERSALHKTVARRVDGILLLPQDKTDFLRELDLPASLPVVIFQRPIGDSRFPAVLTDNRCAGRELTRVVSDHKRIVVLSRECDDFAVSEREEGMREVFLNDIERIYTPMKYHAIRDFVVQHASLIDGAVVICLDYAATIGVLWACRQMKLGIGSRIRLACFADLSDCEIWEPTLCRVEHNLAYLTAEAIRILLEKLSLPLAVQPSEVRVPANIIWGDSFFFPLRLQGKTQA